MTTYITSEAQKIIDWQTIIEQMYSGNKEKKKKKWHKNRISKKYRKSRNLQIIIWDFLHSLYTYNKSITQSN